VNDERCDRDRVTARANEVEERRIDAKLNELLIECGRHETAIYDGTGVRAAQSLPFLSALSKLLEALCGVTSMDRYDDVLDLLSEAL
jgi:hypothetical protein